MTYEMLEPVDEIEVPSVEYRYKAIYDAVLALNGQVLPVRFETTLDAHRFYSAARGFGFKTTQRGVTVYVSKVKE